VLTHLDGRYFVIISLAFEKSSENWKDIGTIIEKAPLGLIMLAELSIHGA
jgi:hypothetical protein